MRLPTRLLILIATLLLMLAEALPAQQVVNGNRVFVPGTGIDAQCPNDAVTGTTINLLAKFTSTGCILATTADTNIPVFIVTSASSTAGNASVASSGQASCVMDATLANTQGFYVIESVTTNGRCHPQSGQPNGVFIVGIMESNATTSGSLATVNVINSFNPAGAPCVTTNGSLQNVVGAAFGCVTQFTYAGSTITMSATGILDLSAATGSNAFKLPSTAGLAPTTAGAMAVDSTSNTLRVAISGATNLVPSVTGTTNPTTKGIAQFAANDILQGIDFPERLYIPAANCNNVTPGDAWSIGSGGTVGCTAGTNNQGGFVAITDTASTFAQFNVTIPEDWDSATNPFIRFYVVSSDAVNGHTIIPSIQVACYKGDGTTTDDVTPNAAHSSSTITLNGTAFRFWSNSNVQMNGTDMTGCVAGALMTVIVGRATDTATNARFYGADVTFPRLLVVQSN